MKYVLIALIIIAGVAGWQFFQGMVTSGYLEDHVYAAIDANRYGDEKVIRDDLVKRAAKSGINLLPSDIKVTIVENAPGENLAHGIVAPAGITATQRKIKVTAQYRFPLLLFKINSPVNCDKSFTERVQMKREQQLPDGQD